MNILPKKSWHVRTRENIARVRKDEAEAAEKERVEQKRIETANREARLKLLKNKSKEKLEEAGLDLIPASTNKESEGHINLFSNFETCTTKTNKDHDKEVKDKQEEYEKKIGYLTYLGQDTNEALKKKNWYETLPGETRFKKSNDIRCTYDKLVIKDAYGNPKPAEEDVYEGEISYKKKKYLDPLNKFKHLCHKTSSNKSKRKSSQDSECKTKSKNKSNDKCSKEEKLKKLRAARLKREQQEKLKTDSYLASLAGPCLVNTPVTHTTRLKPKYNSQFNPELARQNYT